MMSAPFTYQFSPALDVAARSSAGAASPPAENQDNYLLINAAGQASYLYNQQPQKSQVRDWPAGHARVAILDGMGGHGRGREAAEAVVAALLTVPACATLPDLCAHLDALHASLQRHFCNGGPPSKRPGTTMTLLELRPGLPALLYHVGDSRLYEVMPNAVRPLTVDHVPATVFAMHGLLDEPAWWQQVHGEHRSQISQAFILGNALHDSAHLSDPLLPLAPHNLPAFLRHLPDRRALELDPRAIYLLATDGLWACGDPRAWLERLPALLAPHRAASDMADAVLNELRERPPPNCYPDNVTAIVLRPIE